MGRKSENSAVLDAPKAASVVTLPIEYKGRHCPKLLPSDFWRATREYRASHSENAAVICYKVYRLYPVIDRKLSGEELADILNVSELDENRLLSECGSGAYQIYFIDGNARPSSLCSAVVEFTDGFWDRPPVINPVEVVEGTAKNKGYIDGLKARGLWRDQGENDMANAAQAEATNTAVQEMAGIAKNAIAKAGEKQPADAALSQVVDMMGSAYKTALSNINEGGSGKGSGDSGLLLVVKMMQDQQKQQHDIFMELLKQQGGRQSPPAASIDGQLNVVTKMLEFAKTLGGAERPSSWVDRLPDLAVPLLSGLMQRAAAPPPPSYPEYAAPSLPPMPPAPGAPPAAAAVDAPSTSPQDDPMFASVLASMGVPPEAVPFAKVLTKIAGRAAQMFRAGVGGYGFAADVERSEGEETYSMIWSAGLAELVGLLTKFAPLLGPENAALVASPAFQLWLADFFAYGEKNGYGEDSTSEPAATDAGAAE